MKQNHFVLPFLIFRSFFTQSLIQIDHLLSITFSIIDFAVLAAYNRSHLSDPTKHRALFSVHSDLALQSISMVHLELPSDLLRLGFLKYIHFSSPVIIRWRNDFLLYLASSISQVIFRFSCCLSFSSCGTHFPIFWIFPMDFKCMEMTCRVTFN